MVLEMIVHHVCESYEIVSYIMLIVQVGCNKETTDQISFHNE